MKEDLNTRVLIIDDEEIVRLSIAEVLAPQAAGDDSLEKAAAALFGTPEETVDSNKSDQLVEFDVVLAGSGEEGVELLKSSAEEGYPFSVVFLDMRMPGWDGLTTAEAIREFDEKVEIIIITAYSDYSIREIVAKVGINISYACKPFNNEEIRQMALKGVFDWNRISDLEKLLSVVSTLTMEEEDIGVLLQNILVQLVEWTGAQAARLYRTGGEGLELFLQHGESRLVDDVFKCNLGKAEIKEMLDTGKVIRRENGLFMALDNFLLSLKISETTALPHGRIYLLRLFLSHASRAMENTRLRKDIKKNEKLTVLGDATAKVVHDLRNPLMVASLLFEECMEDDLNTEELGRLSELFQRNLQQAQDYLDDVLGLFSKSELQKSKSDLREIVSMVQSGLTVRYKGNSITFEVDAPEPVVTLVDCSRLQRALTNLALNSAEAASKHAADPAVRISLVNEAETAIIILEDNGPGIPEELKGKLFDPFSTSGKSGGVGLGTAIARQVVEEHQGTLEYDTTPEGTRFRVTLPIV